MKPDASNAEDAADDAGGPEYVVRHLTGSRRGAEDRVAGEPAGIGRGRANRIALDPEIDRTVSSRHAEIRIEGGVLVLYDLGSLNGTYVNGRRVRRAELTDGDEIGLGREGPRLALSYVGGAPPKARREAPAADVGPSARPEAARREAPAPRPARPSWLKPAAAVLGVVLVATTAIFVRDLVVRLGALERGAPPSTEPASPAAAPASPVLLVRGVVLDDAGRPRQAFDLGAAVYVRRRTAATSDAVDDEVRAFLAGRAAARVEVLPDGRPELAVAATGRRRRAADPAAPASIVLYELAVDVSATPARIAAGAPPSALIVRRPGFAGEPADVEAAVDADDRRPADPATAAFLRLAKSPAFAGAPLFDGAGALRGVTAGPSRPGLALATPSLLEALDLLETTPAEPLR